MCLGKSRLSWRAGYVGAAGDDVAAGVLVSLLVSHCGTATLVVGGRPVGLYHRCCYDMLILERSPAAGWPLFLARLFVHHYCWWCCSYSTCNNCGRRCVFGLVYLLLQAGGGPCGGRERRMTCDSLRLLLMERRPGLFFLFHFFFLLVLWHGFQVLWWGRGSQPSLCAHGGGRLGSLGLGWLGRNCLHALVSHYGGPSPLLIPVLLFLFLLLLNDVFLLHE